jgi:hypothetical protein
MMPTEGREVAHGRTLAASGASIILNVGRAMQAEDVKDDWVLTHELTHLAFPTLLREYGWLEEGLATYIEPIARARIGALPPDEVWRGLVLGLPKGLPAPGDEGLDGTQAWGRTYWGGALFCLLADIGIREATNNAKSLDDALRGILVAGGNDAVRWDMPRALEAGDRATGAHVLVDLHAQMGLHRVEVDLPALWQKLGVRYRGRGRPLVLYDGAPLAQYRRAITAPDPHAPGPLAVADIPTCAGPSTNLSIGPCVSAVTPRLPWSP